jgi:hypothetical protein
LRLYADGTNYYLSFPGDQVRLRGGATEFAMQESVSGFGAYYTVATNNWWMGQNLAVGGNITATGTITPSDSRLKQAVQSYGAGLDAICTLQPIKFEYSGRGGTTEGEAHIGLSVDEAEAVLPEAVSPISSYRGDKQPDPGEEENPYKGLDYTAVTCALINAVKELAAKVAALESRPR